MRQGSVLLALALSPCLVAACSGAPPEAPARLGEGVLLPPVPTATASVPGPHDCPVVLEARDVLKKHAAAFGAPSAVAASLPRVIRSEVETAGKRGKSELVLDRTRHRVETLVGGVWTVSGVDAEGAWEIGAPGVLVRLRPDESASVMALPWLFRRAYVDGFVPSRDEASCKLEAGRARAVLRYHLPAVGDPELAFDVETAELVRASFATADGRRSTTEFVAWSDPEDGIRYPAATKTTHPVSEPDEEHFTAHAPGAACEGVGGARRDEHDCFSPPPPRLVTTWPAAPIVRPAMRLYLGELSVRASLGSREVFALLDSGAGLTALDATTPAGASFTPSIELSGTGSSQKVKYGLGEVPAITFGGIRYEHVPVVSVPIPALDVYGPRRPEVILGYSMFLGAAVRVDYARSILELARRADTLKRAGAVAVPFHVWDDKWIVDVDVDGVSAPLELDTGNNGGIDLVKT
ncbi:MAG TPA: retropepsin-like aspartic protease [Minicystis sp.]|nr:retropepsin-like aspartic protease [Minicystis sp.]